MKRTTEEQRMDHEEAVLNVLKDGAASSSEIVQRSKSRGVASALQRLRKRGRIQYDGPIRKWVLV